MYLMAVAILAASGLVSGATYYVKTDGSDNNNGSSWEDAFATIQKGIDTATTGDVVEVEEGTYTEDIDFSGKAITVQSTAPGDPEAVGATIINANDANEAVYFHNSETGSSILQGFTITGADRHGIHCNGASPTIENCVITDNGDLYDYDGGGMYNYDASPTVTSCVFYDNAADNGGGMALYNESEPTVTNCLFYYNEADYGGAIYTDDSDAIFINCTIYDNEAEYGGGLYVDADADPEFTNCIFWSNSAEEEGDEVYNDEDYGTTFDYCCLRGDLNGTYFDGETCGGSNNISDDPDFEDTTDEDGDDDVWATCDDGLRIKSTSPCKDAGNNDAVPSGVDTDIQGSPRIIDVHVDMGAYEYLVPPVGPAKCVDRPRSDLNGDCKVDFGDFAVIASEWLDCGLDDQNACWE
jgi:hypothetical protein